MGAIISFPDVVKTSNNNIVWPDMTDSFHTERFCPLQAAGLIHTHGVTHSFSLINMAMVCYGGYNVPPFNWIC